MKKKQSELELFPILLIALGAICLNVIRWAPPPWGIVLVYLGVLLLLVGLTLAQRSRFRGM